MNATTLLQLTDRGLYCAAGDFHIDPWRPVERAVITHAHADHARWGSKHYLCSRDGERVSRVRLGSEANIQAVEFGEVVILNGVRVSLHPAGHILGSAQVRVEHRGEVWVVSGDYKIEADATCAAFEPVKCHAFVTESTFGLPIYRWRPQAETLGEINAWWRSNRDAGKASLLLGYALGKSQRALAGLDASIGPIYTHGAVERLTQAYRESSIALPPTQHAGLMPRGTTWAGSMILAPPSAHGSTWTRKFGPTSAAFLSGWMQIRGPRRRKAVDRGFVFSDHADWPGLLGAIAATGAERVWATHGYTEMLARHLREQGLDAQVVATHFEGEADSADVGEEEAPLAGSRLEDLAPPAGDP